MRFIAYIGRYIKFIDITGSVSLPLACVHVKSMYFTGQVIAAVTNNLDHGMLLANDFAQDAALAFKDFKDTVIRRDIAILNSDTSVNVHDIDISMETNDRELSDIQNRIMSIDNHHQEFSDLSIDTHRDPSVDTQGMEVSDIDFMTFFCWYPWNGNFY